MGGVCVLKYVFQYEFERPHVCVGPRPYVRAGANSPAHLRLRCASLKCLMGYSLQLHSGHIHCCFFFFFFCTSSRRGPFICHQRAQLNHCSSSLLVKITPLQPNNEALFFCGGEFDLHDGHCIGRGGFQLLSVSVTHKQGGGTMGRRPLAPSDCLVVKPTAGASNDKRQVSIISRKGHFRNWFRERERESGGGDSGGYIKKWKAPLHFSPMEASKSLILFNL